jgi:O-antigen/teichoic acid export membrane protein
MEDTRRTIAKNAGSLMLAQIITWSLALVSMIFIPRYLGVANTGKLQLAGSLWAIMAIFISFGTEILLTKEIARNPEKTGELIGTSNVLRSLLFFIGFVIIALFSHLAGYPQETIYIIYVIGIGNLFIQIAGSYQATLLGLEKMGFYSMSDVVTKAFSTIITVILLLMGYGVFMVAFIMVLSGIVSLLIQYFAVKRFQTLKTKFRWERALWMLKAGFPYLMITIFLVLYNQVDVVVLSLILNEEALGWYGAADRLFGTLLFIPTVFITAVFPALTRMYSDGSNLIIKLVQKSFDLLLILSIPIGLGVIVVANPIAVLLFGEEFAKTGPVLATYGVVLIFTYQNVLIGRYFISIDRQNTWTVVMAVATVATIPLDLLFVPMFEELFGNGAIGGGVSFIITEAGMLAVGLWLLPRNTLGRENAWLAVRTLMAGGVMVAVAWPLRYTFILIPVVAGVLTYLTSIIILRVIPSEDWALLRSVGKNLLTRLRKPKSELPA